MFDMLTNIILGHNWGLKEQLNELDKIEEMQQQKTNNK